MHLRSIHSVESINKFVAFSCLEAFLCMDVPKATYPFISGRASGLFPVEETLNKAAIFRQRMFSMNLILHFSGLSVARDVGRVFLTVEEAVSFPK